MDTWLEWARGPIFWGALTFMILGLARHAVLTVWEIARAVRRAGDPTIPYKAIAQATVKWLLPFGKMKGRLVYSVTTLAFHASILVAPVFLAAHIQLIRRGLGFGWPALPNRIIDVLTAIAIVTALALVIERLAAKDSRHLSRFSDYALPLLIALPFASGLLAMHPVINPFAHQATLLIHVLSADLILVLIPMTKLSHMILLPATQLVSEVAWHFTPDGGSKVAVALGKENEPI